MQTFFVYRFYRLMRSFRFDRIDVDVLLFQYQPDSKCEECEIGKAKDGDDV